MANLKLISVVMAAGASTRMKSKRSKLLYPLLGFKVIERAWNQAAFVGSEICVIVGHQRDAIQENLEFYLKRSPIAKERKTQYVIQDPPLGTGDALRKALEALKNEDGKNTHLFIMGGDAVLLRPLTLRAFVDQHLSSSCKLSFLSAQISPAGAYGRVVRSAAGEPERIVEAKNATAEELKITEINAGFYLVQLELLREALSQMTKNEKTGEFYLTDVVSFARSRGEKVIAQVLSDASESLGFNTQEELHWARRVLQSRINSRWLAEGVSMDDPQSTWIDETVELFPDVHLESNVELRGRTRIEEDSVIRSHSIVEDSLLGRGVKLEPFSYVAESRVGNFSQVGPYARLRPGCQLDEKVKIGNFVEAKKSHFAPGSKANHLSYIGDAEVGPESNIGAGTITCNFDGFSKHKTKIGKGVFIGSNTSLVAPVEIDDGSVVGAGSVITQNIPADALSIERSEQRIIQQGGKKFRENRS